MLEFFEAVRRMEPGSRNLAVTLLDENFFGEKLLISDGAVVCRTSEEIPCSEYLPGLTELRNTGICVLEGTRMFCEVLGRRKKIVICGGGHVSLPIIKIGCMLGCQVHVLEDRPKFADWARKAGAAEVTCEPFERGLASIAGDKDTFFVVVTRGHRYDKICLEAIVEKEHGYIGMMGSRRRAARVKEALLEQGKDPDVVNRIYTPIGLDIGAETPEEIAVSVMAEIIQVKNREKRSFGYSEELLEAILENRETGRNISGGVSAGRETGQKKVLATIIQRKGSAPRETGTKMLILPDGNCIGTIGGGCAEGEIIRTARLMMGSGEKKSRICHVDMTGEEAQEEGMVCGGRIEVLLEVV